MPILFIAPLVGKLLQWFNKYIQKLWEALAWDNNNILTEISCVGLCIEAENLYFLIKSYYNV